MKVLAAAPKSNEAIPFCRCDEETKRRGIPRGVGRGVGEQKSPVSSESSENWTVIGGREESPELGLEGLELSSVPGLTGRSISGAAVTSLESLDGESEALSGAMFWEGDGTIFMAVWMRCAITHPTIFSRSLVVFVVDDKYVEDRRNKYAFESASISGVKSGAESARFTVCNTIAS